MGYRKVSVWLSVSGWLRRDGTDAFLRGGIRFMTGIGVCGKANSKIQLRCRICEWLSGIHHDPGRSDPLRGAASVLRWISGVIANRTLSLR